MPTPAFPIASTTLWAGSPSGRSGFAASADASDTDFLALLAAYRPIGGIAREGEIATRSVGGGPLQLARQITERSVLSFEWHDENWLPVFQFEPATPTVKPAIQILVNELSGALDGWELARWFVQPNTWLDEVAPLPVLHSQFSRVHDVARALRYTRCA